MDRNDWRILKEQVKKGKLLPIIGDQVTSQHLFDHQQFLQSWSEEIDYPLKGSFSATRLAQYLQIHYGNELTAKEDFLAFSKEFFLKTAAAASSNGDQIAVLDSGLSDLRLVDMASRLDHPLLAAGASSPVYQLARLPVAIYVTTSYYPFLERALEANDKKPRAEICYWKPGLEVEPATNTSADSVALRDALDDHFTDEELQNLLFELDVNHEEIPGQTHSSKARGIVEYFENRGTLRELIAAGKNHRSNISWDSFMPPLDDGPEGLAAEQGRPSVYKIDPYYKPSEDEPLVYHLLGLDEHPASLVLTEDDYINLLLAISDDRDILPPAVRQALVDSSPVLLGFRLYEWDFRVLFRGLISENRAALRRLSVAIQLVPAFEEPVKEEEIAGAQRYLERYFDEAKFKIFWGNSQEFVEQLWARLESAS